MLSTTPAFGMWSDVRHLWIKNTLNSFTEDKQAFSPAVGVSLLEGTLGKKIYKEDSPRGQFAKNGLHYFDGYLRQTVVPSNPFCSIDALTLGKLARMVLENKIDEFIESDIVKEWHKKHYLQTGRIEKESKFKRELKNKLKPISSMTSKDIAYVFSMLAVAQSQNPDDFKTYSAQLSISVQPDKFDGTELRDYANFDAETMIFAISNSNKNSYDKLVPSAQLYADYGKHTHIPICVEQSLWGFINLVLYNQEKKCLDFSLLPESIKPLPAFKNFIENHKYFEDSDYYVRAANEWMSLVSNIDEVEYRNCERGEVDRKFEMKGQVINTVKVLNYLFGCNAQIIDEYANLLSTSERKISIVRSGRELVDCPVVSVEIQDNSQAYYPKGTWYFRTGHVNFNLEQKNDGVNVYKFLKKLVEYELSQPQLPLAQSVLKYLANVFFVSEEQLSTVVGISKDEAYSFFEKILNLPSFDIHQAYVDGLSLLEKAAYQNNFEMVKLLLKYGAEPTPGLCRAVENNNLEMVKYLVEQGARPTRELVCIKECNFDMIKYLVTNEADPSEGLSCAIQNKKIDIVKYLIDNGADATKGIGDALYKGDAEIINYLIGCGVDATVGLYYAVKNNNFEMVNYFINHGAKVDNAYLQPVYENIKNQKIAHLLIQHGADARATIKDNLRRSTLAGDFMIEHMFDPRKGIDGNFLRNDADLCNYRCDLGINPTDELKDALGRRSINKSVVKTLIERGAHLFEIFDAEFDRGEGNVNTVIHLLDAEVDPNRVMEGYFSYVATEKYSINSIVHIKIIAEGMNRQANVDRILEKIIELHDAKRTDRYFSFPYYDTIKYCVEHGANPTSALAWAAKIKSIPYFMGLMRASIQKTITLM